MQTCNFARNKYSIETRSKRNTVNQLDRIIQLNLIKCKSDEEISTHPPIFSTSTNLKIK